MHLSKGSVRCSPPVRTRKNSRSCTGDIDRRCRSTIRPHVLDLTRLTPTVVKVGVKADAGDFVWDSRWLCTITWKHFSIATVTGSVSHGAIVATMQRDLKPTYLRKPWRYFILGGLFTLYFVLMFGQLYVVCFNLPTMSLRNLVFGFYCL